MWWVMWDEENMSTTEHLQQSEEVDMYKMKREYNVELRCRYASSYH